MKTFQITCREHYCSAAYVDKLLLNAFN